VVCQEERSKKMTNIFIISKHLLFSHGLESLLCQEPEFKIIGQESDISQAIAKIKKLQPNVVIVYQDDFLNDSTPTFVELLEALPKIKVVGLSLHNNRFHVYKATQYVATRIEDLVQAVVI
jgi:two-component system response regulator DegU